MATNAVMLRQLRRKYSRASADRVMERRDALGLTQTSLALRMSEQGFPLSQAAISRAESGAAMEQGELIALAVALECSTTYLLGLTTKPDRWEPDAPLQSYKPSKRSRKAASPNRGVQLPLMASVH